MRFFFTLSYLFGCLINNGTPCGKDNIFILFFFDNWKIDLIGSRSRWGPDDIAWSVTINEGLNFLNNSEDHSEFKYFRVIKFNKLIFFKIFEIIFDINW